MLHIKYLSVHSCPSSSSPSTDTPRFVFWVVMPYSLVGTANILQEHTASIFWVMTEVASSYGTLHCTTPSSITAQKICIFATCYQRGLHNWFLTWSEGFFKSILVMPRGLNGCLGVHLVFQTTLMWTGTIRTLAIFCTKGVCCMSELLFTACSHKINTSVLAVGVSCGLIRSNSNSCFLSNRWKCSVFCLDVIHLLELQAVWCHRLLAAYPSFPL